MHRLLLSLFLGLSLTVPAIGQSTLVVRNNHDVPFRGPLTFEIDAEPGYYHGDAGAGRVRDSIASLSLDLEPGAEAVLTRDDLSRASDAGSPASLASDGSLQLQAADGADLGALAFGLVVIPGTSAGPADAVKAFEPLSINWKKTEGGRLEGTAEAYGYRVALEAHPQDHWRRHDGFWVDMEATVTRTSESDEDAYVALIRRVAAPGVDNVRVRWNGREVDGPISPDYWERDFWYTRGVDWTRWSVAGTTYLAVNGFTPSPILVDSNGKRHRIANHFYVWERAHATDDAVYLISEIAGPNPEQVRSRYMPVQPYTQPTTADTLDFSWRLVANDRPEEGWEDGQLLGFTGFLRVSRTGDASRVDLGVPHVAFGTSYFPYSTFHENFDFYRTPDLDKETWWPFSPTAWMEWRKFIPQMQTDLRIIKAMGFEWVRLHYAGHLNRMPREEAIAYLDFYMEEARTLGLKVLTDSEGPGEWLATLTGRYADVLQRVELENEILIGGINPEDPARWRDYYHVIKDQAPNTQVFLTGAGANGMFEALRDLGVPFDRVGLHAYKHGTKGKDAFSSHALGTAAYARTLGLEATLGEFNWKEYTRLSPETRREEFRVTYEEMLETRSIPEFYQFHFQETLCVNPSISRSGIRHYETIGLDRRPKPEAYELMELIRQYARPDAPFQEVRIEIPEIDLVSGTGKASFSLVNESDRHLELSLRTEAFGGVRSTLESDEMLSLAPGETARGEIQIDLDANAPHGTYHHFLVAEYEGETSYGWGIAANAGAPAFQEGPVLADRVTYVGGPGIVGELDYTAQPLAVAFGPDAAKLELEMGYVVTNTLQSATGRPVRLSSTDDLPESLRQNATLILVGTPETNPLIDASSLTIADGMGIAALQEASGDYPEALVFTGATPEAVQAAATDFVLRYWRSAKDSSIRITGTEPGAALGNAAGITNPDPP